METFILGPCAIEDPKTYLKTGKFLHDLSPLGIKLYYKASFDKANRSSIEGNRGVGLTKGIQLFKEIKSQIPNIKLTTDIHEPWQAKKLKGLIDMIQIPSFLCRQTDLLVECAQYFPIVNIKKSQALSPRNVIHSVDKIKSVNPDCEVWLTERGSNFGNEKLLVDFGSIPYMKQHFDKVIFDVTHSTQHTKPNGKNGGDRDLAERYFQAAPIFGFDGIFAECHPDPTKAISDGDSQIYLDRIPMLLNTVL